MNRGAPGKPGRGGCGSAGRPPELPGFIRAIHGRVGEVVYKTYGRGRDRRFVKTRVPCFAGYVPSAAQRARRDRMREATAYAQHVYADPSAKAFYTAAAKQLGRQPFRLAVSDFLRGHARVEIVAALCAPRDPAPPAPLRTPPPRRDRRGPPRPLPIIERPSRKHGGITREPRLRNCGRGFTPRLVRGIDRRPRAVLSSVLETAPWDREGRPPVPVAGIA